MLLTSGPWRACGPHCSLGGKRAPWRDPKTPGQPGKAAKMGSTSQKMLLCEGCGLLRCGEL